LFFMRVRSKRKTYYTRIFLFVNTFLQK
jgi:hypothetical protein